MIQPHHAEGDLSGFVRRFAGWRIAADSESGRNDVPLTKAGRLRASGLGSTRAGPVRWRAFKTMVGDPRRWRDIFGARLLGPTASPATPRDRQNPFIARRRVTPRGGLSRRHESLVGSTVPKLATHRRCRVIQHRARLCSSNIVARAGLLCRTHSSQRR